MLSFNTQEGGWTLNSWSRLHTKIKSSLAMNTTLPSLYDEASVNHKTPTGQDLLGGYGII